jgi:UDP-N-acetylglucosamine 2-epimerase (non-hydrolysing)
MHFAPTQTAVDRLLAEDVDPEDVVIAGNTVVDAVRKVASEAEPAEHPGELHAVVTIHRRENWGEPFELMCESVRKLVESRPELGVSFVMHPNPALQERARAVLGETDRVRLLQPMGYLAFVGLLTSADVILTDSGGIQEEAVSLEKPLVVLRRSTERTEGVDSGVAVLAGAGGIGLDDSMDEALALDLSADRDLYGDGRTGERIAKALVTGHIWEAEWS